MKYKGGLVFVSLVRRKYKNVGFFFIVGFKWVKVWFELFFWRLMCENVGLY